VSEGLVRFSNGTGPGPSLALTGEAVEAGDRVELDLELGLDRIATDEIADYWPERIAGNGRDWVVGNVEQGYAENAEIELRLSLPKDDPAAAEVASVAVAFDYSDLSVHFLRPMPPVTGISGSASFDGSTMRFLPTSGHYGDIQVVSPKVEILGLDGTRHSMAISAGLTGPLASELKALDHPRLKLIEPLGIDPGDIGGAGEALLEMRFPLLKDLKLEQMEIVADASLADVSARAIVLGLDMTKGQLSVKLNKAGMRVTGPLQLAGVPLALVWQEDFSGTQEPRTAMQVLISRVDQRGLAAAGLDFRPYVEGPVSASLLAHMRRDGTAAIQSAVNLEQALIDLPFLKWRKPAGVPGEARFQVVLKDDELVAVEQLALIAGGLEARGRVGFADGSKDFTSVALDRISFGRNDLTNVVVRREGEGFAIELGSGELDAAPYLEPDGTTAPAPAPGAPKTPLGLSAQSLSRVYVGEAQWLERVGMALDRSTAGWERVRLVGHVPQELRRVEGNSASSFDESRLEVAFAPDGQGRYDIAIDSNDMGSLLTVFDIFDTVVGGSLEVRGKSDSPALEGPMLVDIEARDYKLQNAPALAQLLTVASLTGIVDILSGEGISFQRLTGRFVYDDGALSTELARAYGPAIGLTASGTIAFERDQVDLEGTVVPAYTVNRVLGAIPVLGWILVGGEGEGVLAVTYEMKGDLSRPQVTVNPLAALAPGFLRGLFGFLGSDGEGEADARPRLYPGDRGR